MVSICNIYPCNYIPSIIANLTVEYETNRPNTYWEKPLTAKNGTFATFSHTFSQISGEPDFSRTRGFQQKKRIINP